MRIIYTLLFISFFLSSNINLLANKDQNHKFWVKVSPQEKLKPQSVINKFYKENLIQETDSFKFLEAKKDKFDVVHQKYQLYKNGFPIEDNLFSFHLKNGDLIAYHGRIVKENLGPSNLNVVADEAINIALQDINAQEYAWQNESFLEVVKKATKGKQVDIFPKPELMYHFFNEEYQLAYKLEVITTIPQANILMYIDAETGEIIEHFDATNHATGSCATIHHGTQNLEFDQNGSTYELADDSRKMETFLFPNNQVSYSSASIPTSTSLSWLSLAGNSRAALDIHWATQVVYDVLDSYQITSFDDSYFGADIISYVNYGNSNVTKNNAFWNGYFLTYGSGGGFTFPGPVTSLDVAAHEFGHALTQEYGDGLFYFGESGAINESISDMLAAAVESRVNQNPIAYNGLSLDPWILSDLNGNGIRDMSNPNAFNHPDTYEGTHWKNTLSLFDNGGVHFNSGVGNFWFYLLAQGGTGTNDNGDNYQVLPLGYDQAMRAVLRAYSFMDNFADYEDFRNATILGSQLNNNSCSMIQQIINAWDAVGVGVPNETCSILVAIENNMSQFCEGDTNTFVSIYPQAPDYTNTWRLNGVSVNMPITIPAQGTHLLELVATNDTSGQEFTDELEIHSLSCNPISGPKNNWLFGYQKGFNFSNGMAVPTSFPYENFESITTYSHEGELAFYLSANPTFSYDYGAFLMDSSHTILNSLAPVHTSSIQAGPCVASPNITPDSLHHYVNMIVNSSGDNTLTPGYSSLYQFTVDIIDPQNPVLIGSSPIYGAPGQPTDANGAMYCGEGVTVIPSCDPNIFWILASNNFTMHVFELNYNTLWTGSVSIEHTYSANDLGISNMSFGSFKVTPNAEKVLHGRVLYSFDQTTGELEVDSALYFQDLNSFGAFSANSQFYYNGNVETGEIYQFDMLATDILGSKTSIGFSPYADNPFGSNKYQDFCLGPDNRLYIAITGEWVASSPQSSRPINEVFISVINKPDVKELNGSSLFNANAYYFEEGSVNSSRINFPSFIQANLTVQSELELISGVVNCNEANFASQQCKPYYSWKFGDGDSLMLSNEYSITHTYTSNGTYVASLTTTVNGLEETIFDTIVIKDFDAYPIQMLVPSYVCEPFTIVSATPGLASYQWSVVSGSATIQDPNQQTTGITWLVNGPTVLQLEVTDNNGCAAIITKTINVVNEGEVGAFIPEQDPLQDIISSCELLNMPLAPRAANSCAPDIEATTSTVFPITSSGTSVIVWNYDDGNGNTFSQNQNVIIADNIAPVPTQNMLPEIEEECVVASIPTPTALDNCTGQITATTSQTFPITNVGFTLVIWNYDDGNGNTFTQTQNVLVVDIGPIPNEDSLATIEEVCSVKFITPPTATDDCDGQITGTTNQTFPITSSGTTIVTWTFTDSKGSYSTQIQTVNITGIDNTVTQSGNVLTANASGAGYTYMWFDCKEPNTILPNNNGQSYTITYTSSYAVKITYEEECEATSICRDASVINSIGNETSLNINLYPNPVNDFLYVESDKPVRLEIYNAIGKLITTTEANTLNMKQFATGLYFVNIYDGESLLKVERLMKK